MRKEDEKTFMITNCNRKEHCVCCNERSCETRICYSHFKEYCKGKPRWLTPPTDEENEILAEPGPEGSCACDEEQNLEDIAAVDCRSHMDDDWQDRLYRDAEDEDESDDEEDWDAEIQDGDCDDDDSAEGSILGMEGVNQEQREEAEDLAEDP